MAKKIKWHRIANDEATLLLNDKEIKEIQMEVKTICITKHNGRLYAFAQKCPHAGGYMTNGYVDPLGNVVCPLHRYKFSMENGRNTSGEGYYLKTFPVEIRADGVFVGIEESGFSFW